ncbi:Hsp70 family protein, partial [Micromonospora sp. 15K316]|uniref:outer membrane protein assembly factor BamB family protein n=1 Tax=Micromonospora sp. 15K316 TaxID=2530376 RepID=UPI0010D8A296
PFPGPPPGNPVSAPPGGPDARPSPPGPVSPAPSGGPAAPAGRRRTGWIVLGAVVALAGVATAALLYLTRDRYPGLDFHAVQEVKRVAAGDERSVGMWTAVLGDRAYLAYRRADGELEVTAVEAGTGEELWRKPTGVAADDWERIVAVPGAVVAYPSEPATSEPRGMVVLDAATGAQRWKRAIRGDDDVYFTDQVAVLVDRTGKRLAGLRLRDGEQRWELPNPQDEYGGARTTVVPVGTDQADAGPGYLDGGPRDPWRERERRLLQVGADRSVRVIEMNSGNVVGSRGNVADLDDLLVAHEDRLYVAADEGGYQLLGYDLNSLSAQPVVLYRAPDEHRRPKTLVACGEHRACLLEVPDSTAERTVVVAATEGETPKSWPAPNAGALVPVGERLLVRRTDSPATSTLFDPEGKAVLRDRRGVAVRLDAGNLLVFAEPSSTVEADRSVAGVRAGTGEVTELGELVDVRSSSCSWNTRVITCGAEKDFVIYRFAAD